MCCALSILALLGPRVLIFLYWLTNRVYFNVIFQTAIWPILGFLFLPWTMLSYMLVFQGGIDGIEWLLVGLGLVLDIASYSGSAYGNKDKLKM